MCNPIAIPIAIAAVGAGLKAAGDISGADSEKKAAEAEKAWAEKQAADAEYRGGLAAGEAVMEGSEVQGAQRVAMAAAGIDLESDFARNLQVEAGRRAGLNAATIRANAAREAWGFRAQAATADFNRRLAKRKAMMSFWLPGINMGAQAAGAYYQNRSGAGAEQAPPSSSYNSTGAPFA